MDLITALLLVVLGWTLGTLQTSHAMRQPARGPAGIVGNVGPSCDPGDFLRLTHQVP